MPKLASANRSITDYPTSTADIAASYARPTRVDMASPDGLLIHQVTAEGGHLELHDSTRPDVAPVVFDDFLMAVMRGEVR